MNNIFFTIVRFFHPCNLLKITLGIILLIVSEEYSYSNDVINLERTDAIYRPRQEVYYLWDKSNSMTFDQVRSNAFKDKFIHAGAEAISFGIKPENMWFRVSIKNSIPDIQREWILEMAYPHFDSLEFYCQNQNGKWDKQLTGDMTPFNTRKIFNKHFTFPIVLSDTCTKTVYFRIGGEGSRQFPLYVQTPKVFHEIQEEVLMIYGGMFFGTIIIMMFYNLFIYLSLRDKIYIYYVLTNISILLFYLGYTGYGFQFVWKEYYWINEKIIPLGALLAGITTIYFSKVFLETKKYVVWLDKIFSLFLIAYIVALSCFFFVSYTTALKAASLLASLSAILVLISSYVVWIKGNRVARFIAFAFSFYLVGIVLLNLNIAGLVHRSFFVAHAMEIGTVLEMTLLSLALSEKYSTFKRDKEKAQAALIQMQRTTNEELERKIERRTLEINRQKQELEKSNKVKDKLLSIISHDLKGPLNAFQTLLSMMLKDELTTQNINMYTSHLNNKLGLMINLVDNILNWVRTQMEGMKFDIKSIHLKALVKENIHLFASQAELKNISIIDEVEEVYLLGDKNVVRMVVRNLLANAIKFTNNGGCVYISATTEENQVVIEIRDTGIGIDEDKIKLLFTDAHFTSPDTNQNAGTGIGLLLCKEFLSKTSGDIWVESTVGTGSSFKFSLAKVEGDSFVNIEGDE